MMIKCDNSEKSVKVHFGHESMVQARGGSRILSGGAGGAGGGGSGGICGFSKNFESFVNFFLGRTN